MIQFDKKRGTWTYVVNGKVVRQSKFKEKLENRIQEEFGGFVSNGNAAVEIPKAEFTVAERFEFIEEFTKLVSRGIIPSLVVTGSGGLGKTHTVTETLKSLGKVEDTIGEIDGDFISIRGYSTPRSLFETLYDNNGKIIIFDDCDSVWSDSTGSNILKAALDSNEKRIISWGASGKDDNYPTRFEFIGKVIIISNFPINKIPQTLLSRSMLADITLSLDEKIERISQIFKTEKDYNSDDKKDVIAFIKKYAEKAKDLNIRSAFNILKLKVAVGDNWERIALYNFMLN